MLMKRLQCNTKIADGALPLPLGKTNSYVHSWLRRRGHALQAARSSVAELGEMRLPGRALPRGVGESIELRCFLRVERKHALCCARLDVFHNGRHDVLCERVRKSSPFPRFEHLRSCKYDSSPYEPFSKPAYKNRDPLTT